MPLPLEPAAEKITQDKVLYVGGRNADVLPDEMILPTAYHFLRAAVDTGCSKICIKRGRWNYEFEVADMLRQGHQVQHRGQLGRSLWSMQLAGTWKDNVNF